MEDVCDAMKLMDKSAVSYQIVLTKADKIGAKALEEVTAKVVERLAKRPAAFPQVLATSSEKGTGIAELRAEIVGLAG